MILFLVKHSRSFFWLVPCDLLMNRRTGTWNLFVKQIAGSLANQRTAFRVERWQIYMNIKCTCFVDPTTELWSGKAKYVELMSTVKLG